MNAHCLEIKLEARSYNIFVGADLLAHVGKHIAELIKGRTACVITDSNVGPLYLTPVVASLEQAGFSVASITVPAGEHSKDPAVALNVWEALAKQGMGRDGVLVALGGGVVGDLAGFVASTYMRGIACVQIPTSLLAMVDSSVGGKTAINVAHAKNLVGTFTQPLVVFADVTTLQTLPDPEWDNGLAEIAKSALVDGGAFFSWISERANELREHRSEIVQQAIILSIEFKGRVVSADERETSTRECLNYGHTFAHALEAAADYSAVSHGRAVAAGMRFAACLAEEATEAHPRFRVTQELLLDALGLSECVQAYPARALLALMLNDKKVRNNEIRFVFVSEPGTWQVHAVDSGLIKKHLLLWEQARLKTDSNTDTFGGSV